MSAGKGGASSGRMRSPALSAATVSIGLALIACLGIAMELYLTRNGAGTNGDSVHYLNGAQNMLAGHGYSRSRGDGTFIPINTFPPIYPLLLAGLSLLGPPPLAMARYLGAFLLGANVFLIGWIIFRQTRSVIFSAAGALLAVSAINLVKIHSWVMSESPYIFFSLLVLLVFQTYGKRRSRGLIVLCGVLTGLGILTRYFGFSLLGAGLLVFFILDTGKFRDRLLNAILYGASSSILVVIWLVRNSIESDTLVNKVLRVHWISSDLVAAFFQEIASWVSPSFLDPAYGVVSAAVILAALASFYFYWQSSPPGPGSESGKKNRVEFFTGVLTLYLLVYLIIMALNTLIFDASTDTDGVRRYLIPAFPVVLIWITVLYARICSAGFMGRNIRPALITVAGLLFVFYAYRTASYVRNPGTTFGYTDNKRLWVGVVATLKEIGPDRPIIASDYEQVLFLADRPPYSIPLSYNNSLAEANPDYRQNMQEARDLLKKGAILVALGNPQSYDRAVNGLAMNLEIWKEFSEARFYVDPKYLNQP